MARMGHGRFLWILAGTALVAAVLLLVTFGFAVLIMNVPLLETVRSAMGVAFGVVFGFIVGSLALLVTRPIPRLERGTRVGIVLVAVAHLALRIAQSLGRGAYIALGSTAPGTDAINLLAALATPAGLLLSLSVVRRYRET